jgi:uroporphyrinogen-III synthase
MRPAILVTRPRHQAVATARALHRAGFRAIIDPLLSVQHLPFTLPPLDRIAALLLTSANAVTAFEPVLAELPVFAVGKATGDAALRRGWLDVQSAGGDARSLAAMVATELSPDEGLLVHLSGEDTKGELGEHLAARGFDYRRVVIYRAVPATSLAARTRSLLEGAGFRGILLFSPRTAAIFRGIVENAGLVDTLTATSALCLSEDVAARVRALPWRSVEVAPRRSQDAVLACLEGLDAAC